MVFNIIFIGEMSVKMVALGLFNHDTAYFSSSWNKLDFIIVVSSITDFIPGADSGIPRMTQMCLA